MLRSGCARVGFHTCVRKYEFALPYAAFGARKMPATIRAVSLIDYRAVWRVVPVAVWLCCCTGAEPRPAATTAPSAAPAEAVNVAPSTKPEPAPCARAAGDTAAPERYHGLLSRHESPKTMSVEAFEHVEFKLETASRMIPLLPSQQVPHDTLAQAAGKELDICCSWRDSQPPSANEAYPMGSDGKPLARPARCEVRSLSD
jgi:hypothetical protein